MRINKYIASSGFCSRRKAEEYINAGVVTINGEIAVLQSVVQENDIVKIYDTLIQPKDETLVLLYNKPVGIVCTTERHIQDNIIDTIHYHERIFPIGRLDKDSSGLILLTNNGDLVNDCLRAENGHEKEYIVEVDHKITDDFITKMSTGVKIYNPVHNCYVTTLPAKLQKINKNKFSIILTQGYNRQIRRMCSVLGYHVLSLKRIRFLNLKLDVKEGEYRLLNQKEISLLLSTKACQ